MSDKLLWNQIKNDNHKAFKKAFDLYYDILCSYIIQFTYSKDEAEDIVQSTYIKLWEKRRKLTIKTSLKSYLFRSAYHLFIDQYKKGQRQASVLEKLKYEIVVSTIQEDKVENEKRSKKMRDLVNELPEKCKEILLLSKEKGLKNKEIALELDISIKTVESQIRIAFQKIRNSF